MDEATVENMRRTVAEYDQIRGGGNGESSPWGKPKGAESGTRVMGVQVPIKVQTPDGGSIRLYLTLPAEVAASEESLLDALTEMKRNGVPLDVYQPREERGGWGGGGQRPNSGGGVKCFNCGRQGHMASECRQPGGGGSRGGNSGGGWGQRRGGW